MNPVDPSLSTEALYSSLIESLPLSVFQKDRQFRILFGNQRFCQGLGRTLEQLRGQTDFDLFPRELAEKFRRDDLRVIETGEVFEDIEEICGADGQRRHIQVLKTPVRNSAGEILGVQGMFWDITDRRIIESHLKDAHAFLDSIVENVPIMLFVKDAEELRFVRFNRASEELVGLQREEVLGKCDFDLFPPDEAEFFTQKDRAVLAGGTMVEIPDELIDTRNNGTRTLHTKKIPVLDSEGRPRFLLGISEDITEKRQTEAALREAKEAAEAASRAKSDFLANMSHEIRTPMNAVLGMTELLLDTQLDETQRDYLRMVQESGEALLCLINDILDFSKIEAGKFSLDRIEFSLDESLGDTMKTLAVRAADKELELAIHIASDVPQLLLGDPGRLRQIVINLVGNALKFTERGEIVLSIACSDRSANEIELLFQVRDTGIGIPEDQLERIFRAFEQVDTSTTRRYGGTGLGLTITARLLELMEGRIWVESTVGKGTTFSFTARFGIAAQRVAPRDVVGASKLHGVPVLLVDDNVTNRLILREILENHHMLPEAAASAAEALHMMRRAKAAGHPYPLLLSDVHMPEVDGYTLIEQIRQDEQLRDTAIIVLTSGDRPGDKQRCEELGVATHLRKPVKQSELMQAIALALNTRVTEPEKAPVRADQPRSTSASLRILLAEDSHPNQILAMGLLGKRGHQLTIVNNGREAIDQLQRESFDLVLMDVQMPIMDGLEATRTIRQLEADQQLRPQLRSPIPIVAMTAHAMKGDRERCLESGMSGYVSKPIRNKELDEVLAGLFSNSDQSASRTILDTSASIIDWSIALRNVDGDKELLHCVAEALLTESVEYEAELVTAVEAGDAAAIERLGHSLKGALSTLGAASSRSLAAHLEILGRTGDVDSATECLTEFREQLHKLTAILTDFVNGRLEPK